MHCSQFSAPKSDKSGGARPRRPREHSPTKSDSSSDDGNEDTQGIKVTLYAESRDKMEKARSQFSREVKDMFLTEDRIKDDALRSLGRFQRSEIHDLSKGRNVQIKLVEGISIFERFCIKMCDSLFYHFNWKSYTGTYHLIILLRYQCAWSGKVHDHSFLSICVNIPCVLLLVFCLILWRFSFQKRAQSM